MTRTMYIMDAPLIESVRRNVRRLREQRGMSQLELAQASGLHRNAIALLETGKSGGIRLETLDAIAAALGVEISDLIMPERGSDDELATSLSEFLASPMGSDVTQAEASDMRRAMSWIGRPTPRSWAYVLDAIRSRRKP